MGTGCIENIWVNLYYGDLTILPLDVIINDINSQLKHTRGGTEAIVKAGGPCIQSDSDACLQSVGNVKEGAVIVMGEVGDLPCISLLNIVNPTWHDGTHGESSL